MAQFLEKVDKAWFSCPTDLTCYMYVAGWNWQRSAICTSGFPAHLQWMADVLKFAWNANQIFNSSDDSARIVLIEYVESLDDVTHNKNSFIADNHHLACEVELNSTSQASQQSLPGIDYDSMINVQICQNGVPSHASGYVPVTSSALSTI